MCTVRDEDREFSSEVRQREKNSANYACRMCGIHKTLSPLQTAHIYTLSLNPNWERSGSNSKKWHSDQYVSSYENCLLLCTHHHHKIDSKEGLKKCTVEYLESLKEDMVHCTALIDDKNGKWRRCRNYSGRNNPLTKGTGYRCYLHLKGGKEETLGDDSTNYTPYLYPYSNVEKKEKKGEREKGYERKKGEKEREREKKEKKDRSCIIC